MCSRLRAASDHEYDDVVQGVCGSCARDSVARQLVLCVEKLVSKLLSSLLAVVAVVSLAVVAVVPSSLAVVAVVYSRGCRRPKCC